MSNYANVAPPLSPFFPLQTPFAFRGIVRVDASLLLLRAAYSCEGVLSFDEMFCRPTTPFCDNKNRGAPRSFPSLFGKFYSCWSPARRSCDIWRFDIDVSVSGFRPPPPPPFFSSFFVHPFLLSFSSPASPRMNGKGESAADNADKLPSKSLLCVCAPYRSPSLAPFPPSSSVAAAAVDRPPIESSLQLAFSEREGKRVR